MKSHHYLNTFLTLDPFGAVATIHAEKCDFTFNNHFLKTFRHLSNTTSLMSSCLCVHSNHFKYDAAKINSYFPVKKSASKPTLQCHDIVFVVS